MRIALVYPWVRHTLHEENIPVVSEEFGVHPPLNLAYLAALVRQEGHEVIIIDANALKLTKEETVKLIKRFKPDIIGHDLHSTFRFHHSLQWIRYLKENTGLPIIVGGPNITLYPKETMLHKEIDYGIVGAGSKSFLEFISAFEKGKSLTEIPGLCFRKDGKTIFNKPSSLVEDLEKLPLPARDLLPNEKYHQFITQYKNCTIMITSTGCPYNCLFCNERGSPYKERSVENVLDEIEDCYLNHKVREIDFFDRTFTINRKRIISLCKGMKERGIKINWSCRARVDTVDKELLTEMKRAGCFAIFYGIESADQKVLENINKRTNLAQVKEVINLTSSLGIKPLGFFMFGNPGETVEAIDKSIKFARSLNLKYATFTKAMAKPKSYYDNLNIKNTGKDYWSDYVAGKCEAQPAIRSWTNLSDKILDNYVKKAFYSFYFRPSYIFKTLMGIKSFEELKRYVNVGTKIVLKNGLPLVNIK